MAGGRGVQGHTLDIRSLKLGLKNCGQYICAIGQAAPRGGNMLCCASVTCGRQPTAGGLGGGGGLTFDTITVPGAAAVKERGTSVMFRILFRHHLMRAALVHLDISLVH